MRSQICIAIVATLLVPSILAHSESEAGDAQDSGSETIQGRAAGMENTVVDVSDEEAEEDANFTPHIGVTLDQQEGNPPPQGARASYHMGGPTGDNSCWINGRRVPHGTEAPFSNINPCWTKLCWYGRLHNRNDGCFYQQQCRNFGHFDYRCSRMSCSKSMLAPGRYQYNVDVVSSQCIDANDRCRREGERNFPARIRGMFYSSCTCLSNGAMRCINNRHYNGRQ